MKIIEKICIKKSINCNHDFKYFWKTNYYGKLEIKEVKCIYCYKKK